MYRIIVTDLNTRKRSVYRSGLTEKQAKSCVKELNLDSLFDDKHYSVESEDADYDDYG